MKRVGLFFGAAALLGLAACGATNGTATPTPVAQTEAAPVDGARNDVPGAVPELLLKAESTRGDGVFGKVSYVQRLSTKGGVAPAGGCREGAQTSVHYEALYTFSAPAR